MTVDLAALLGATGAVRVTNYTYDFARDGGAEGMIDLAGDALPLGAQPWYYFRNTGTALTYDGPGFAELWIDGAKRSDLADDLGAESGYVLANPVTTPMPAQRLPQLKITDADATAGKFDLALVWVPT